MSSINIHKIVQDPFGFLWVATQDGLNLFDGRTFIQYNKKAAEGRQILTLDCRDLFIDSSKGLLWVLANEGGLNAINYSTGTVEKTVMRQSDNPDDWAISFECAGPRLWIGTGSGLSIYNIETNQFEKSPLQSLLSTLNSGKSQIRLCKRDRFNNIWACINGLGIAIINSATLEILKIIPAQKLNNFGGTGVIQFFSAVEINNSLIFGTSRGLRSIKFNSVYDFVINNSPIASAPALNFTNVDWIDKGPDGQIYISAGGLFSLDSSLHNAVKYADVKSRTSAWLKNISCGWFAGKNLIFLGCREGLGLIKLSAPPFEPIRNNEEKILNLDHVYAVWPLSEDSVLAATNSGLYIVVNKDHILTIRNDGFYQNISRLDSNNLIVSNTKGLNLFNGHKLVPLSFVYKELREYQFWEVNSCVKFNDSMFVLGTENFSGIILWDRKNKRTVKVNQQTSPLKLKADGVNTLYKDKKGNLWVLSDKAITIISNDLRKYRTLQFKDSIFGQPLSLYFDMCQVGDDYWIATYSIGLIQLDSTYKIKKIYTMDDGLCNGGVYKIFNVDNQKLIVTTNNGLSVFNISDNTFSNYYQQDGLHSSTFEEACGVYNNEKIYVGGSNGFTILDPQNILENREAPLLYISKAEINIETEPSSALINIRNVPLKEITIPNNSSQVKIFFDGLNFSGRTTFCYKINELHHDWIKLGTQNFVTLVGTPPGTYHLMVMAFNESGIASTTKEILLVFKPKIYQTSWFKLLIALLGISFVYVFYRIRINQLKHVQKIKNKLASDLHDDLGSTLNSVKVYSSLAMADKQSNSYLLKIKQSIQEAITGLRDMIWVLDDKKDTIEHLLMRISAFAVPLCDAYNIHYKQDITDDARTHKLGQEERRNLYMIMKEAINNSVKYSNGSKIEVAISLKRKRPLLNISDNGKGFNTQKENEGYGLRNMATRAIEIGYKLNIHSAPNEGTAIYLNKM